MHCCTSSALYLFLDLMRLCFIEVLSFIGVHRGKERDVLMCPDCLEFK